MVYGYGIATVNANIFFIPFEKIFWLEWTEPGLLSQVTLNNISDSDCEALE